MPESFRRRRPGSVVDPRRHSNFLASRVVQSGSEQGLNGFVPEDKAASPSSCKIPRMATCLRRSLKIAAANLTIGNSCRASP
jgi:hypothetical protein